MSYFNRPCSPPPREPSPEPIQTPLPSPHLRARDRQRLKSSPLAPPGLAPPRILLQSRSFDHLERDTNYPTLKRRTRSNIEPTSPTGPTPVSLPYTPPSTSRRRTVSAGSSQAPVWAAIPPVPPLPVSARSSPLFKPQNKTAVTPIFLPELHDLSPVSPRKFSAAPTTSTPTEKRSIKRLPSLFSVSSAAGTIAPAEKEKTKNSVAMTCLKFFTLRRQSSKSSRSSATQ